MAAYARFGVKVTANSTSLAEARSRVVDFYKAACRSLPAVMEIYNLHDVATVSHLRSNISEQFRKNAHITNPKVIDMLIFKGMEELGNVVEHSKQRHHILGQYVIGPQGSTPGSSTKDSTSDFLKNFYTGNYV